MKPMEVDDASTYLVLIVLYWLYQNTCTNIFHVFTGLLSYFSHSFCLSSLRNFCVMCMVQCVLCCLLCFSSFAYLHHFAEKMVIHTNRVKMCSLMAWRACLCDMVTYQQQYCFAFCAQFAYDLPFVATDSKRKISVFYNQQSARLRLQIYKWLEDGKKRKNLFRNCIDLSIVNSTFSDNCLLHWATILAIPCQFAWKFRSAHSQSVGKEEAKRKRITCNCKYVQWKLWWRVCQIDTNINYLYVTQIHIHMEC